MREDEDEGTNRGSINDCDPILGYHPHNENQSCPCGAKSGAFEPPLCSICRQRHPSDDRHPCE